ncbi:MAG TPA: UvrD-helicase domain-containing protein [Acidimicrobiales bacterium]|nr:UvrD-helicase domain-containing protein [Acidimicrobiales bacterium]
MAGATDSGAAGEPRATDGPPEAWHDEGWDLFGDLDQLPDLVEVGGGRGAERDLSDEVLLEGLNPAQRAAVTHEGGPLVVIAGAGSGKTRVLTRRIARLVATGTEPWRILAITFTNKAAGEMRERVVALVGDDASKMWVSTFHSACVRILRRNAERISYRSNFTIYDDGDSRRLIEHILDDRGVDQKRFPARAVAGVISQAKSELVGPDAYDARAATLYERRLAEIYLEYERRLVEANAMDFDDLLVRTVGLFRDHPDVLEGYQERFAHVLVDEYQDTNVAQNEIVMLLGRAHRNVCVVGDTDQSIYRFRGAEMRNLLDFEHAFPDATVILLEQNYRSTQRILDAANAVISNNMLRQPKQLWSALGEGERVKRLRAGSDREEAAFVADEINSLAARAGVPFNEIAVFYRTNAQSRALEEGLMSRSIPYKVIGGTRFYDRREIRDLLAYLKLVVNEADEVALRRVLNVPRRGIGETTVTRLVAYAAERNIAFADALADAPAAGASPKAAAGIRSLLDLLEQLGDEELRARPPAEIVADLLERTGYTEMLEAEALHGGAKALEAEGRLENLAELVSVASEFDDLESFLETATLASAADEIDDGPTVSLMTLHAAKGLEFSTVFLTGMEEGLFPHNQTLAEPEDIEEERRLCYVGITRARERLYLTHTWSRLLFGSFQDSIPSRFLKEIPEELIEEVGEGSVVGAGTGAGRQGRGTSSWAERYAAVGGAAGRVAAAGAGRAAPATTGAEALGLRPGDAVVHDRFGAGVVTHVEGEGEEARAEVRFSERGVKRFLLALTPLRRVRG